MKPWKQRAFMIAGGLVVAATAVGLIINALNSNIALYVTPSEVRAGKAPVDRAFRIGGMVKAASLKREGTQVQFVVTDTAQDITVRYTGILPDLFKEGKGAVVQGKLADDGIFSATEVLAKHDENYMPPAAQHALDQAQKTNVPPGAPPSGGAIKTP
jgi:cytochrome c-type biogenesis protein CcmE